MSLFESAGSGPRAVHRIFPGISGTVYETPKRQWLSDWGLRSLSLKPEFQQRVLLRRSAGCRGLGGGQLSGGDIGLLEHVLGRELRYRDSCRRVHRLRQPVRGGRSALRIRYRSGGSFRGDARGWDVRTAGARGHRVIGNQERKTIMNHKLLKFAGALALLAVLGKFYAVPAIAQAVRAAVIKNIDERGRVPYQATITCVSASTVCQYYFPAVPAHSRLVIEYVGVEAIVNSG